MEEHRVDDDLPVGTLGAEAPSSPSKEENASVAGKDIEGSVHLAAEEEERSNLEISLERLLQRQRSEVMFELRRLQYGDRPVTGQEQTRRTIERLVNRAVRPVDDRRGRNGQLLATANRLSISDDHSESHRPEEILVEVNALVERRPVSSILQSLGFRRSLENSVRGALQTIRSAAGSVRPNAQRTRNSYTPPEFQIQSHVPPAFSGTETNPTDNLHSISDRESDLALDAVEPDRSQTDSQPILEEAQTSGGSGSARAQEWIQRHQLEPNDSRYTRSLDLLEQMHHEEFIMEISDLIHRRLVTSTLNGNFRDVLERRLGNHIEASGLDGARVRQQLQQLPRSTFHRRNDFNDLGIVGPEAGAIGGDQLDNMSVISATAAVAIPQAYSQSNVAMTREIQSLRNEMQELKNMLRLSFELQTDIQRSIKQEIAAALSSALTNQPDRERDSNRLSHMAQPRAAAAAEDITQCLICLERPVDTVLYQCGHLCLCNTCALQLRMNESHCPMCRAPIRDIIRTYRN